MRNNIFFTDEQLFVLTRDAVKRIQMYFGYLLSTTTEYKLRIYGVPPGGEYAAKMILHRLGNRFEIIDTPKDAHLLIVDILLSVDDLQKYKKDYYGKPIAALIDNRANATMLFPWTGRCDEKKNLTTALQSISENIDENNMLDITNRILKYWKQLTIGNKKDPMKLFKTFENCHDDYNEMIVVRNIPFYSLCRDHLAPFFGTATIGYVPKGKIVETDKLLRLLNIFSKRVQDQRQITDQVAETLYTALGCRGTGVMLRARHMCDDVRGQHHEISTRRLFGVMRDDPSTRNEFISFYNR